MKTLDQMVQQVKDAALERVKQTYNVGDEVRHYWPEAEQTFQTPYGILLIRVSERQSGSGHRTKSAHLAVTFKLNGKRISKAKLLEVA